MSCERQRFETACTVLISACDTRDRYPTSTREAVLTTGSIGMEFRVRSRQGGQHAVRTVTADTVRKHHRWDYCISTRDSHVSHILHNLTLMMKKIRVSTVEVSSRHDHWNLREAGMPSDALVSNETVGKVPGNLLYPDY